MSPILMSETYKVITIKYNDSMKETAVEWLFFMLNNPNKDQEFFKKLLDKAKEIEKTNIDNKAIHFAEWLTKKHTLVLMELYEQFEEQYYNGK